MSTIILYGPRMGSSLRAHWMLAELELPYESKQLNLQAGEQRTPEYLALNPAGQVPTIVVDGFVLAESMVITRYLAARFKPELNGRTLEEAAKGAQWEMWVALNLQHHFSVMAMQKWTGVANPEGEAKARESLAKHLPLLEMRLGQSEFLAGDVFTTADINASVGMSYAQFTNYDLTSYPQIQRWMKTVMDRPACVAARPPQA